MRLRKPAYQMVSQGCVGGARRQRADVPRERVRGGLTAVWHCCANHLIDVHAVVTRQRPRRRQVVGSQESGDDAVLVHLSYCGAIHEINQAALVHGDACWREGRGRVRRRGWSTAETRCLGLHDSVDRTRWLHVSSLASYYSGHCKKHSCQLFMGCFSAIK